MIRRILAAIILFVTIIISAWLSLIAYAIAIKRNDTDSQWQMWIAADQLINTFLRGHADEAISARAWRRRDKNPRWARTRVVIDALFKPWHESHCEKAFQNELDRAGMDKDYRKGR